MTSHSTLKAALLEVRAFLAQEAQAEDFRNEAAWEAGSSHEERAAIDALARLDEALRQINSKDEHSGKDARGQSRSRHRMHLHGAELAA